MAWTVMLDIHTLGDQNLVYKYGQFGDTLSCLA